MLYRVGILRSRVRRFTGPRRVVRRHGLLTLASHVKWELNRDRPIPYTICGPPSCPEYCIIYPLRHDLLSSFWAT